MKKLMAMILMLSLMLSMFAMSASAAYEPEAGDIAVEAVAIMNEDEQMRIGTKAGGGTVHYNKSTNKSWGESYAFDWGGTSYMYVYCLVTANDGTNIAKSNSKNYDGSDTARSLTTAKITCTYTSGRHSYTSHTITGSWNGTEYYTGNVDW